MQLAIIIVCLFMYVLFALYNKIKQQEADEIEHSLCQSCLETIEEGELFCAECELYKIHVNVKDGVCLAMMAGINGAKQRIDTLTNNKELQQ